MKKLGLILLSTIMVMVMTVTAFAAEDKLVMHWAFDNANTESSVGDAKTTVNGDVTFEKGMFGDCIRLDGMESNLVVEAPLENSTYSEITMSYWINLDYLTYEYTGILVGEYKKDGDISNHISNTNSLQFGLFSPTGVDVQSTEQIEENKWYFITLTYKDDGMVQVYINGELSGEIEGGNIPITLDFFTIGAWISDRTNFDTASRFFSGCIDDVRIYNTVLTTDQIKNVMNNGNADLSAQINEITEEKKVEETMVELVVEVENESTSETTIPLVAPQTSDSFVQIYVVLGILTAFIYVFAKKKNKA